MIVLSGADIVLPDRVLNQGTLVIDGEQVVHITEGTRAAGGSEHHFDPVSYTH
jgi:hypothetical protein